MPVSPFSPCGMSNEKLNTLEVFVPVAETEAVAGVPAGTVVATAVGVPNPAAAPSVMFALVVPLSSVIVMVAVSPTLLITAVGETPSTPLVTEKLVEVPSARLNV